MIEFCQKMEVNKSVNMGELCVKLSKNNLQWLEFDQKFVSPKIRQLKFVSQKFRQTENLLVRKFDSRRIRLSKISSI